MRSVIIRFVKRGIILWLFVVYIYLLFSGEITADSASGATLNPELLPLCLVAKQQVMSRRVSGSNIRNDFLNVGCTQFKMNLILMGVASSGSQEE